jgi:hypothetical protein
LGVDIAGRQRFENAAIGDSPVPRTLAINPAQLGSQPFQVADFPFDLLQALGRYPVDVGAVVLSLNGKPQGFARLAESEA